MGRSVRYLTLWAYVVLIVAFLMSEREGEYGKRERSKKSKREIGEMYSFRKHTYTFINLHNHTHTNTYLPPQPHTHIHTPTPKRAINNYGLETCTEAVSNPWLD